jgi:hypothetical protein
MNDQFLPTGSRSKGIQAAVFVTLLAAISSSLAAARANDAVNCKPNLTGFDICEQARSIQQAMAPNLPMQLNANITLQQALAVGVRLSMVAIWNMDDAALSSFLATSGYTKEAFSERMQALTQNSVCSQPVTAAFVRLGGEVDYVYKTTDLAFVAAPLVKSCPGR